MIPGLSSGGRGLGTIFLLIVTLRLWPHCWSFQPRQWAYAWKAIAIPEQTLCQLVRLGGCERRNPVGRWIAAFPHELCLHFSFSLAGFSFPHFPFLNSPHHARVFGSHVLLAHVQIMLSLRRSASSLWKLRRLCTSVVQEECNFSAMQTRNRRGTVYVHVGCHLETLHWITFC